MNGRVQLKPDVAYMTALLHSYLHPPQSVELCHFLPLNLRLNDIDAAVHFTSEQFKKEKVQFELYL